MQCSNKQSITPNISDQIRSDVHVYSHAQLNFKVTLVHLDKNTALKYASNRGRGTWVIFKGKFAFRVFPVEQGPWEVRVTQKLRSIAMLCGKCPNLYSTISKCGENSPFVVLTLKPCYTGMFTQTKQTISVHHLTLVLTTFLINFNLSTLV